MLWNSRRHRLNTSHRCDLEREPLTQAGFDDSGQRELIALTTVGHAARDTDSVLIHTQLSKEQVLPRVEVGKHLGSNLSKLAACVFVVCPLPDVQVVYRMRLSLTISDVVNGDGLCSMATWLVYPFLLLPYLLDLIPAQDPDDPFAMHFDESFRTYIRTIFSSPDAPNE